MSEEHTTLTEKYEGKDISLIEAANQAGLFTTDKVQVIHLTQILHDLSRVDITKEIIDESLERPIDFCYSDTNDVMFVTWSLGPVYRTRDSNIIDLSNADALDNALEEAVEQGLFSSDDYNTTGCRHWAVGQVDHLSFRAIVSKETREPTVIFMWLTVWCNALEEYPIADNEDYSRRQWEYALETLDNMSFNVTLPRVDMDNFEIRESEEPDNWKEQALERMTEIPNETSWHEDEAKRIALELGFLACSDCDGDGWVYGNKDKVNCDTCDGAGVRPRQTHATKD